MFGDKVKKQATRVNDFSKAGLKKLSEAEELVGKVSHDLQAKQNPGQFHNSPMAVA